MSSCKICCIIRQQLLLIFQVIILIAFLGNALLWVFTGYAPLFLQVEGDYARDTLIGRTVAMCFITVAAVWWSGYYVLEALNRCSIRR
jgi:hypothetical protein